VRSRIGESVSQLLRRRRRVRADRDPAGGEDRQVGDRPEQAVPREDGHALARRQPFREEGQGELIDPDFPTPPR